jgi:hypothetical protein
MLASLFSVTNAYAELHGNLTHGLVADTRSQKDGPTDGRSHLLALLHKFVKLSEDTAEICTADTQQQQNVRFMADADFELCTCLAVGCVAL